MTDTMPAQWSAPLPPAPEPQHVQPHRSRPVGLIVALVVTALAFVALGAFTFVQHGSLTDSQAQAASLTTDLHGAKADLAQAKDDNAGLRSANHTLTANAKKCSVLVPILNHNMNALKYMGKAVSGGTFGSLIWLPMATSEVKQATGLFDSHQSYSGELWDVCGPSSTTNS